MNKYSNYLPEKWLAHLGNRNFYKFYHLIAELLVIWNLMMETFNPVPVVDYIGAREVLLSLFYEPLALLAEKVPKEPEIAAPKYTAVSSSVKTMKTGLRPNTVQSRPMTPRAYA